MSIYEDTGLLIYCCALAAVTGMALGSFLNCAAFRISKGESFVKGSSRCPVCGHELGFFDLIPLFSWVAFGGKCRYCKAKISVRYPLAELLFSVLTVLCLLRFDLSVELIRNLIFISCLFCLSLTDLQNCIIPNGCLLISAGAWLVAAPLMKLPWTEIVGHLLCALLYGGGMLLLSLAADRLLKKESLGGGDIKLFAVMGLYLGMTASLFALLLSCVLGLVFAFVRKLCKPDASEQFPLGPAIAVSIFLMLLYGQPLVDWYLRLIGI